MGVSYDTAEAQKAFREGQNFEFRLISDIERSMSRGFEAARPPDHEYAMWPYRVTYLVGPDATIRGAWKVEDLRAHPEEVLEALRSVPRRAPGARR